MRCDAMPFDVRELMSERQEHDENMEKQSVNESITEPPTIKQYYVSNANCKIERVRMQSKAWHGSS